MAQDLIDKIRAAAQAKNVDPDVAVKIAQAESSLNPEAGAKTSSAKGLFQIVNKTWSGAGGKPGQQKNPDENIRVGTDLIASNTDFLRKNLGRDPRASEVYAAHFFGPTGASTLLAAAPDTPASSLFSSAVLKANPQLQGMNAEQIRGMLSKKMGETAAPAPAQQAATPAAPTPAEKIVEPALRSGMSARATDLGPGYQAALALSFLGADDEDRPESDSDLQARLDREEEDTAAAQLAAYKPFNALASLDLSNAPVQQFADGGEVETPMLFSVPTYAETVSHEMYPGQGGQFDQKDAARHMLAAGTLARKYGPGVAEAMGNLHEIKTSPLAWIGSKLGISQMPVDYEQDLHNNRVGIELAKRSKSQKDLEDLINLEAERAKNQQTPGAAWIGKPVRRADGSPQSGEQALTLEEIAAASQPATFNPKIARQGEAARSLAAQRDVNTLPDPRTYAAVSGFLGTPVDQQGFSVLHPDLEGIKKAGDVGFYAGTAAQIAPAVGAMRNLAGKGVTESAKALEGLKNIPVGASVKPVEPFFRHMPTEEAPFVGRLDEFVAGMQNPVRKDQFLGQLTGKFRDYDIERAQRALADLPANAKLTPSDLLNKLKERYDPANMRTTVLDPEADRYFSNMDNPYKGQPVGVIHLSSHVSPEQLSRMQKMDELEKVFYRLRRLDENSTPDVPGTEIFRTDPIANTQVERLIAVRQDAIDQLRPVSEAKQLMNDIRHPILSPRYDSLYNQISDEISQTGQYPRYDMVHQRVKDIIIPQAEARLTQMFGEVPASERALKEAIKNKFGEDWINQMSKAEKTAQDMTADFRRYVVANADKYGVELPYYGKGTHSSLKPPPNSAGFTRFVEQKVQDPDRGPLKGIHLLEIQSDLTSELKAGRDAGLKKHEVFPNMPENRRVVQQLGMKNAISAALNRGDQFVTFPGKESAKPQLYESVRDNLKQVAKDLGPGFEVRPFTFKNADGDELQHWGITWDAKAAARTQIKGVPFKDGGAVERVSDDNRRYL